jgi:serine/threonine protein phosphatase PrpC
MARSFGDFCLKEFGLIVVPDVSCRRLTERDEFIILFSDGFWDVLSNKEVVDIVALAPSQTTAARDLVEYVVRAWRLKYPTSKVDDCAVVCLFLNNSLPSEPKSKAALAQGSSTQAIPKEITSVSTTESWEDSENKTKDFLIDSKTNTPTLECANSGKISQHLGID